MKPGGFFSLRKMGLSLVFFIVIAGATLLPTGAVEPTLVVPPAPVLVTLSPQPLDYNLPYPGILPDSPLYFLKVARDKLALLLIQHPTDRVFYLLFLADKRLAAARELELNRNLALAAQTYLTAEEHLAAAVDGVETLSGKSASDAVAKLTVATAKHKEILGQAEGREKSLITARQDNAKSYDRVRKLLMTKLN